MKFIDLNGVQKVNTKNTLNVRYKEKINATKINIETQK